MYNGLLNFIDKKKLNYKEVITSFLAHKGKSKIKYNSRKANYFINDNWESFATFVDNGLKNGTLSGERIKLNSYYDEVKERRQVVSLEFKSLNLTKDEEFVMNCERGKLASVLKKVFDIDYPKAYDNYVAKKICRKLPVIEIFRNNGEMTSLVNALKNAD